MKSSSSRRHRTSGGDLILRYFMSVLYDVTIREIMLVQIFTLFLFVNFSHSEYRQGMGIYEINGNSRREDSGDFWESPATNLTWGNGNSSTVIHFPSEKDDGRNKGRHEERNQGHEGTFVERHEKRKEEKHEGEQNGRQEGDSKRELLPRDKCGLDVPRRIIGGFTTDIDEFPWLTLLQYVNPSGEVSHDCSGVLISKRYVLTAAHCTHGLGITTRKLKLRKVRLGEWDTSTEKDCQGHVCSAAVQEIDVEDVIPHGKYKPRDKSQVNDIALIRLRQEANLNQYVQPICLPFGSVGTADYEKKKLTVSGWGRTSNVRQTRLFESELSPDRATGIQVIGSVAARNSASSIKMKVDLPVTSWERCRQFYDSYYGELKISGSQFCAGGEAGKDSCQGDSGGPLMTTDRTKDEVKWFVIGIVSSGPAACAVEGRPSLYTNVSQFTDWILNNIKN